MLFKSLPHIAKRFEDGFRAYPLSSFASILLTFSLFVNNYSLYPDIDKVIEISLMAIPLFVALKHLRDDIKTKLLGVAFLVYYGYFYVLGIYHIKNFFLFLSFCIMIVWTKHIKGADNSTIWAWTRQVLGGFVASFVVGFVVFGGVSLAFWAVDMLFGVDFSDHVYERLAIVAFAFLATNLFLSSLLEQSSKEYSRYETIFGKYLLVGLSAIYFLILFVYDAKTLVTLEMPKGVITWLSIGFSTVAILTYLYLTPFKSSKKKLFWLVVFLQTFMLFYAIGIRIDEYGVTPNRYFVVMFGVWLFGLSLYFLIVKNASYKWIFITMSFMAVFSQFGYFSAHEVSKISQIKKLKELIAKNSPLSEKTSDKIKKQISDTYFFLQIRYGDSAVEEAIPSLKGKLGVASEEVVSEELGFDLSHEYSLEEFGHAHIMINNSYRTNPKDVKGFDKFYPTSFINSHQKIVLHDGLKISIEKSYLILYHDGKKVFEKDLSYLLAKGSVVSEKEMTIIYTTKKLKIKIVLVDVDFRDGSIMSVGMDIYVKYF